jgi:catechol 2,3-dioxygenase-like lactoylglutathione lyase family enzyme
MKRLHVHVGVDDLDRSIAFYSTLFGAPPTVAKGDYAKWMLDDPRVNFAISSGRHAARGVEHLGIQAENEAELGEVYGRLRVAGQPVLEEGATTCCYARSEKSWVSDPDGVVWEAFHTTGEATIYGEGPALSALSDNASETSCRAAAMAASAAAPSCCG